MFSFFLTFVFIAKPLFAEEFRREAVLREAVVSDTKTFLAPKKDLKLRVLENAQKRAIVLGVLKGLVKRENDLANQISSIEVGVMQSLVDENQISETEIESPTYFSDWFKKLTEKLNLKSFLHKLKQNLNLIRESLPQTVWL
ncbi:MAG: hypothetical protein R3A80_02940 [Bdellovibrionota bacterium]